MPSKTIAITAYKRPKYFERLILSLIKNDLQGWEIHIQLEPSDKVPYFFEIAERLLEPYNYFIGVNPTIFGVRHNPYHMLENIFISGSLCCIYLEEDLVVSPDITKLANWYLHQDHSNIIALNLLLGGCVSAGFISNPSEPSTLVKTKLINSLGLIFTNEQWIKHIKPNWLENSEYAIDACGAKFNGWDLALYNHILSDPNLQVLQPICSRVTHIGELDSTHVTAEFQKRAFDLLSIYDGVNTTIDYYICNDIYQLPHCIRSHINLWQEMTNALITLKQLNEGKCRLLQAQPKANILSRIKKRLYWIRKLKFQFN